MADALSWEATATVKRPYRVDVFARITGVLRATVRHDARILELGSGPGFLASHLLSELPRLDYHALDFSAAMHELAAVRLGRGRRAAHGVEQ